MIYLVRHGQTDWNAVHKIQGHFDIPLNQAGREEALICGQKIQTLKPDKIISSDLTRAKETAEIINQFFHLPISLDARLREVNYGDLEGILTKDVQEATWETFYNDPHALKAEALEDVYKRVKSFFDDINPAENTLLITHGGVIRMIMYLVQQRPVFSCAECRKIFLSAKVKNTDVFQWDFQNPLRII